MTFLDSEKQPLNSQNKLPQTMLNEQEHQYIQPQLIYTMGKHLITKDSSAGCGNKLYTFNDQYPKELSNCLSSEEYKFIISTLNKETETFRTKNLLFSIINFILQIFLVVLLIWTRQFEKNNSIRYIIVYSSLLVIFAIIYIISMIYRRKRYIENVQCLISQMNIQYCNRNIKIEVIYKRRYVKGYIYYPNNVNYVLQQQLPQLYTYQPSYTTQTPTPV